MVLRIVAATVARLCIVYACRWRANGWPEISLSWPVSRWTAPCMADVRGAPLDEQLRMDPAIEIIARIHVYEGLLRDGRHQQ